MNAMLLLKLAYRNLVRAGLRTWLNALVLSFSPVAIIGLQGLYIGMGREAERIAIDTEYGGGQYWHKAYDPYDPLSIPSAHGKLPHQLDSLIEAGKAVPILMVQGTAYPEGRSIPLLIKGILPEQNVLDLPSDLLKDTTDGIPAFVGERMASTMGIKAGDFVTLSWRDVNGTFDAADFKIVGVMSTVNQNIDRGQIWVPIRTLQQLTGMENEATIVVVARGLKSPPAVENFEFKDLDALLGTIRELVKVKTQGSFVLYFMLIAIALLSIFDTQVFSIFKRRKEIGTLMAFGFTKFEVVALFTLEGAMYAVFSVIIGAIYGIPLLWYSARTGWSIPQSAAEGFSIAIGRKIYPTYSLELIIGTVLLIFVMTAITSYLPTRQIAKMRPTEALRGGLR